MLKNTQKEIQTKSTFHFKIYNLNFQQALIVLIFFSIETVQKTITQNKKLKHKRPLKKMSL